MEREWGETPGEEGRRSLRRMRSTLGGEVRWGLRGPRNLTGQGGTPRVAAMEAPARLPAPPSGEWGRAGYGNNALGRAHPRNALLLGGSWVCDVPPPNPSATASRSSFPR